MDRYPAEKPLYYLNTTKYQWKYHFIRMKLVDQDGNEITSAENKEAKELEKQLGNKTEKLLEPILNKVKLSGGQIPQQQLMQLSSMAHQILFNRMVYNLAIKVGIENINDLISDDDVKELQTSLSNQLRVVDPGEQQGGEQGENPKQPNS